MTTRNAWQSLAYSSLGAIVSPLAGSSEHIPCERAKNARGISPPSLLSRFSQHYLVAMARSLDKSDSKVQTHHLHTKRFHMVKILSKSVQYIRRYSTKYASCFGRWPCRARRSQMSSVNPELLDTKFYTIYRSIIYAVNAHNVVAISYSIPFLNAWATKWGICNFFHKIGCHGIVPWDIGKIGPDRSSAPETLSFGEKTAKIGPVSVSYTHLTLPTILRV